MPLMKRGSTAVAPAPAKAVAKKAAAAPVKSPAKKAAAPSRSKEFDPDAADAIKSGFAGGDAVRQASSSWANTLKMSDGEDVIGMFLDEGPYASFRMHWLKKKGKISYICHATGAEDADDCPLCGVGDRPRASFCFNFLQFTSDGAEPVLWSWEVGVKVYEQIKKVNAHRGKTAAGSKGPITAEGHYYILSRTGSGKDDTSYTVNRIKASDITADHELEIPDAETIAKVAKGKYTKATVLEQWTPRDELEEIAAAMLGDGGYDTED